jgi:hypothetical protein
MISLIVVRYFNTKWAYTTNDPDTLCAVLRCGWFIHTLLNKVLVAVERKELGEDTKNWENYKAYITVTRTATQKGWDILAETLVTTLL